ncbi:DUF6731 family protein [Xanthobacter oligotrophicus]|uniref:DUF6731 family protein n=1 Tax=Xanthobacter oligotrophicus TaxID=2607286 RepID=A0ABW6ZTT7_9HYPH
MQLSNGLQGAEYNELDARIGSENGGGMPKVTVKFWQILPAPVDGVEFADSLKAAFVLPEERTSADLGGVSYQLEKHSAADALPLVGDVIRLQSDGLPSRLKRGQKAKRLTLEEDEYLGYHTGFIFDPATRVLGFEVKAAAAGLTKLTELIAGLAHHAPCQAFPVLSVNDINRLAGTKNGVLRFKLADPASLSSIDPELEGMRDNLEFLKEMVDGAYISVAIGVGPRKTGLSKDPLLKIVGWLLGERESKRGKVKSIRVGQPHESEPILDFIKAHFKDTDALDLSGDPEDDWAIREAFLRSALAKANRHVKRDRD